LFLNFFTGLLCQFVFAILPSTLPPKKTQPARTKIFVLDTYSNGLVHTAQRLKGTDITAHLELTTGVRSELADLEADLL